MRSWLSLLLLLLPSLRPAQDWSSTWADLLRLESLGEGAEAESLRAEIANLEEKLKTPPPSGTSDEASAQVAALEDKIQELETALAATPAEPAATGQAASGAGQQGAIILQTIRSSLTQHKNRVDEDEQGWKDKEVAIGKGIQQLLSMVQKNPSSREMVYGLLNDLQGVLDTGRKLVKRNRQFIDDEEAAIAEMEKNL